MRKSLWIVALLVGAIVAPNAWADSFDASFTCTSSCASVPTDPFVWFPSPTIPILFFSENFTITLGSFDSPTDQFTWDVGTNSGGWYFQINDLTNNTFDNGPTCNFDGSHDAPYGAGGVNFDSVPEPSSVALLLLGVGIVFVARKRTARGLAQAR